MKTRKLKRCPFCGGKVRIVTGGYDGEKWFFISRGLDSDACKCRLFLESEKYWSDDNEGMEKAYDDLVDNWNRRI